MNTPSQQKTSNPGMKALCLVPGGIGDQILFFPTLDDLKRYYPEAQIDVIVEPRAKSAYRVCKSVQTVIPYDFKDRNGLADWGNLLGVIRDREYDVVLSVGRQWSAGLLLWLSGVPSRIGYAVTGNWFFTNPVPFKESQYAAEMYHDLLQGLGINTSCPELAINVPKQDIEWAETEQKRLGITETGYILINGGSTQLMQSKGIDKIYPVKKWQQIIENLQQRQPDLPVVVLQGPDDDQELVSTLVQGISDLKVTSPADIGKMAAMIAGANLMLCTDNAPMHLSVAVGTYTIALFGSTEAKKLLPQNDRVRPLQSPTRWIADISPADVLEQIWGG